MTRQYSPEEKEALGMLAHHCISGDTLTAEHARVILSLLYVSGRADRRSRALDDALYGASYSDVDGNPVSPSSIRIIQPEENHMDYAPRDRVIFAGDAVNGYTAKVIWNGAEWECVDFRDEPTGVGFYPTHWHLIGTIPGAPTKE